MTSAVQTYDPRQLTMTVGGFILSGFFEDEVIRVVKDDDNFFKRVGVTGEIARVLNFNQCGSITVSLLQTSASNDDLSALASLDLATGGLAAVPITMRDKSGRSLYVTAYGWVRKFPDSIFGKDVGAREWIIDCATLLINLGGNS